MHRIWSKSMFQLSKLEWGLSTYLDCRAKLPWEVWGFIKPCFFWVPKLKEPSVKYWSRYLLYVSTVFIVCLSMFFSLGQAAFFFQSSNISQTPQQNFPSTRGFSSRGWMQLAASAYISANGELSFPLAALPSLKPGLLPTHCPSTTEPVHIRGWGRSH